MGTETSPQSGLLMGVSKSSRQETPLSPTSLVVQSGSRSSSGVPLLGERPPTPLSEGYCPYHIGKEGDPGWTPKRGISR